MAKDYENFDDPSPSKAPLVLVPFLTALVSVAVGATIGGGLVWTLAPRPIVEVPRDLTADELDQACRPLMRETVEELDAAQTRVANLESQIRTKEDEVVALETEMVRRAERGAVIYAELKRELEEAKAELVTLQGQLDQALEEKAELIVKLEETEEELEDQKEETREARADALDQGWMAFVGEAQIEICDRGNRKRLGKCRESVTAAMNLDRHDKWRHCVASGQAMPVVKEAAKKESPPEFGEFLNQDDRIIRDWYVLFCDPSLPEAQDLLDADDLFDQDRRAALDDEPDPWDADDL